MARAPRKAKKSPPRRRYWMGGKRKYSQDQFFEESLDSRLWQPGDEERWDACWYTGMPDAKAFRDLGAHRKINHIPGNNVLTIKNRLHESLVTVRERLADQFGPDSDFVARMGFVPRVYSMPEDYHELQQVALENPQRRWILKPKNAARGKGVRVLRDAATAPMQGSWMVQEYLDRPHTMRGHKYVLRLYMLIAGVEPFRVYLYEQGFAKLASAAYDPDDPDNVYSHLTNPDVNALNTEAEVPVEFVDLEQYRAWLREQGHDDEALFARIRDLVALTAISAAEPMCQRSAEAGADPRGCYELIGIDCMVDADLKPWVLECNLSPSLEVCAAPETGGETEERIKRQLIADMVSLVGLNEPVGGAIDAASEDPEEAIRRQGEQELARAGGFRRLFPAADADRYLPCFPVQRLPDMVLAQAVAKAPLAAPVLQRRHAEEVLDDDGVSVYDLRKGRLNRLNDTAAFIWLMAMEGNDPDAIAEALIASSRAADPDSAQDPWSIRCEVWKALAQWAQAGLLMQQPPGSAGVSPHAGVTQRQAPLPRRPYAGLLRCGVQEYALYCDAPPVIPRLESLLAPLLAPMTEPSDGASAPRLEVVRDAPGYSVVLDGEIIDGRRSLGGLVPALGHLLGQRAAAEDELLLDAAFVAGASGEGGTLFLHASPGRADALALHAARRLQRGVVRGLRLRLKDPAQAQPVGLPLQIASKAWSETSAALDAAGVDEAAPRHLLRDGEPGILLPSDAAGIAQSVTVAGVVIASGAMSDGAGSRPATVAECLANLLPVCYAPGRRPMSGEAMTRLAEWLEARQRVALDVTAPAAVQQWLREGAAPAGECRENAANSAA